MSFLTIKVNAKPTVAPTVSIDGISNIKLPINQVTATCNPADSDGTITHIQWSKVSGGVALIDSPNTASTTISNLGQGNYTFKVVVTDNDGLTAQANVSFTVNAANVLPNVNAGIDQSVIRTVLQGTVANDSVTLSGTANDSDGNIASTVWSKISGPNCTITSANSLSTTVTGLLDGTYVFQLQATDNEGGISTDTIQVAVKTKPNISAIEFIAGSCCSNFIEVPDPILQINSSVPDSLGRGTLDFRNGQPGELIQLRFSILVAQLDLGDDQFIDDIDGGLGFTEQGIEFSAPVSVATLDAVHYTRIGSVILNSQGSATSNYRFVGNPPQGCFIEITDRSSNVAIPTDRYTSISYQE